MIVKMIAITPSLNVSRRSVLGNFGAKLMDHAPR
jgi:hypothetical protein